MPGDTLGHNSLTYAELIYGSQGASDDA